VGAISSASAIAVSQPAFTIAAGAASPTVTQTTQASAIATNNLTIVPQAPNAGATGANGTPGMLIVNTAAPVDTGLEAGPVFQRVGVNYATIQPRAGFASIASRLWLGPAAVAITNSNWSVEAQTSLLFLNAGPGNGQVHVQIAAADIITVTNASTLIGLNGNGHSVGLFGVAAFGGGTGVVSIKNAGAVPTTNPASAGILYEVGGALTHRGSSGETDTIAAAGSALTINSQAQIIDRVMGTCQTVSSATPTIILNYTTKSGSGGFMTMTVIVRATTTGAGILVGDVASAVYTLGYRNIAGTVTLSTAGITLSTGSNVTTAAALTAPVLTTSVATNVVTILVTNVNLAAIDCQLSAGIPVN
jgi:hypothetical protein